MVDENVPDGILLHDSDKKFRPYTLKAPRETYGIKKLKQKN